MAHHETGSLMLNWSKVQIGVVTTGAVGVLVLACGTQTGSEFGGGVLGTEADDAGAGTSPSGDFGSAGPDTPDAADIYANDPPAPWCGPGKDPAPAPPGGTVECPDDKNKPGCSCSELGKTAACWTGLRKNRNLGICKDGQTTCIRRNENSYVWGPCEGQVLPKPGAKKGKDACACFSEGQWKIANLSPCLLSFTDSNGTKVTAASTSLEGNTVSCPEENPLTAAPSKDWSTNTLKVDCAGHYKLCLRIRQGVFENPSKNDCILGEVCVEGDYTNANVEQKWPNLPGWLGQDIACAKKWSDVPETQSAGYAEMVVKGTSVRCDAIDDGQGGELVFNRLKYCPTACNDPANNNLPECVSCQQSGQGKF